MQVVQTVSDYEQERGKPMPSKNHALVQTYLGAALLRYDQDYSILMELSLELAERPLTPDIAIYPKLPVDWRHDEVKLTEAPLMVVEILSPRQVMDDLVRKADAYFEGGVKSCWIVLPMLKTVAVLLPGQDAKFYTSGEVADSATGISIKVEEIFRG